MEYKITVVQKKATQGMGFSICGIQPAKGRVNIDCRI